MIAGIFKGNAKWLFIERLNGFRVPHRPCAFAAAKFRKKREVRHATACWRALCMGNTRRKTFGIITEKRTQRKTHEQ
jgi:hypothetical protein